MFYPYHNVSKHHGLVMYMSIMTQSALIQVMAWHLLGAKPFPEPMLTICQLGSQEQIPVTI